MDKTITNSSASLQGDTSDMRASGPALELLIQSMQQSTESVIITDAQLDAPGPHIVFVNEAFTRLTGYTWEEVQGKSPRLLQGPHSDRNVLQSMRQCMARGERACGETVNYRYNDTFGHPAGDVVLKPVAARLQELARHTDFVARYGGEEFLVILPNTDAAGALHLAERFREGVESHAWPDRPITISLGVASYTEETPSRAQLLAEADAAIYRSKQNGRNQVMHYAVPHEPLVA